MPRAARIECPWPWQRFANTHLRLEHHAVPKLRDQSLRRDGMDKGASADLDRKAAGGRIAVGVASNRRGMREAKRKVRVRVVGQRERLCRRGNACGKSRSHIVLLEFAHARAHPPTPTSTPALSLAWMAGQVARARRSPAAAVTRMVCARGRWEDDKSSLGVSLRYDMPIGVAVPCGSPQI